MIPIPRGKRVLWLDRVRLEAVREMQFRDFPEIFQPTRLEIQRLPAEATIRRHAGVVFLDLLSAMSRVFVSARQLSDLVRLVPLTLPALRVDLVVALFPKVVDLPEFHRVLFALTVPERREVVHRLGMLNLWDPHRPDGDYVLDLSVWEERVMASMLAQLAVTEPGPTFRGLGGRGGADFNDIPGWRLPTSWLEDTPRSGLLRVHVTSTDEGSRVKWDERRRLCRQVLTFC